MLCANWDKPPVGKITEKSCVEEGILSYMALHIEYWFHENLLLQCYFSVFLPAGCI